MIKFLSVVKKTIMNKNKEYWQLTKDIEEIPEFQKLKEETHHLLCSRYDHCQTVAVWSFRIAKLFKLDVRSTTRAALVHDWFYDYDEKHVSTLVKHPQMAYTIAREYIGLNEKEQNIIQSHMWPLGKTLPKYKESWLVTTIDKIVSLGEYGYKFKTTIAACTLIFLSL